MRVHSVALLAFALSTPGCAALGYATKAPPPPGGLVHTFTQGSAGGRANTWWVETAAGPVVVDVPLTLSNTAKLRSEMEQPYRIYITSGQPERFGGLTKLREGGVPAYSTPSVVTDLRDHGEAKLSELHRKLGDDVAAYVEPPDPAIEERTHDMIGDVEMAMLPLGPAAAEASLAIFLPKTGELLAGDLIEGHAHLDLSGGRSAMWADRIAELKALGPKWVYPGHGQFGGPELLDQTLDYIKYIRGLVADKVKPGGPAELSRAQLDELKATIEKHYPDYTRTEVLDRSLEGEYLAQLAAAPPPPPPKATTPTAPGPAAPLPGM